MKNQLTGEGINKEHKLVIKKTIPRWDEAIPLGNGVCGALIWGTSMELRFSLDRSDIWDTTPFDGIFKEEYSYENIIQLAKEGNICEISRIFDTPYVQTLPSKLPAGKLIFDFNCDSNVYSELNIQRAEAEIRIGETIQVNSFLHAERKLGLIRINRPSDTFTFKIENPKYGILGEEELEVDEPVRATAFNSLKRLHYPMPRIEGKGNCRFFVQSIGQGFSYGVFAMVKETRESVEIAYIVATSEDGEDWERQSVEKLEDALKQGYDVLLTEHVKWWEKYWSKSSIAVPDKLFEKNWYLTQYFLASCSRKGGYPMQLQGVWTADDGALPPWKGDYHFDLNVQMCYYSYLKANHIEEGEALIDYLWSMVECARKFAKSFYHSNGLCLPPVMSIAGDSLGGWAMYALSPTNQIWISQIMERHYRFTGDRKFLEEKAYPYMEETARFILGLLEEREGLYYLPVSSSPEIHDNRLEAFLTPNSNYDLALMRYLFETLAKLSRELQNGMEEKWEQELQHLPELAVNEKGVLMLSPDESLNESHRHLSHAMAIHPLRILPYEGEEKKQIIDATILDLERLGTGYWVGFSYAWMAELYAIQRNGNGAAQYLELFWKNYCSPNGFHLNSDYKKRGTSCWHTRPFTLEANFGAADALQEMLLQSENNVLRLFPAVPEEWLEETVSFYQFRAEKGLLVSAILEQGKVTLLSLKPEHTGKVYIKRDEKLTSLFDRMTESNVIAEEWIELYLCGNKEYVYQI